MTIADLKKGERGIIKEFDTTYPDLKLLELGCLPGNEVELLQLAPLKDPLYITINGTQVAIRKETAATIEIVPLNRPQA